MNINIVGAYGNGTLYEFKNGTTVEKCVENCFSLRQGDGYVVNASVMIIFRDHKSLVSLECPNAIITVSHS